MSHKHVIKVLDGSGHQTLTYDPSVADEVEAMRVEFDAIIRNGGMAFATDTATGEPVQVKDFDPTVSEITIARQIAGG